ncbi:sporozoite invasion-associated protein 1 (SIAP1) [Babesia microti strain RI]|uniref:Sporozoite invasion-associated protein 1 (SIAP1) n=1 Tax=Babesia microti (strain RI) TaxID=1133968 RepID=A0A1N6LXZ9_BABMR|nr:sporozoite invasion-associated protein 1 (SIAP1) [Babesia microti strain RI]SIO73743.1 sporozoite invasion-associated protein 1 (SIAP1) [Babesia microti strain RI]|eukprot:XP_021337806.1 sporozoite invasion-associated protein 1 (SIAP1) [Babesia microti strain RI]
MNFLSNSHNVVIITFVTLITFTTNTSSLNASYNESNTEQLKTGYTFAELGMYYEPKYVFTSFFEGASPIHSATSSNYVMHDIVIPRKDTKLKYFVSGNVKNLVQGKPITVMIGTMFGNYFDMLLDITLSIDNNRFKFDLPRGRYYIKLQGSGYMLPGALRINLPCRNAKCPFVGINYTDSLEVYPTKNDPDLYTFSWRLQNTTQYGIETVSTVPKDESSLSNTSTINNYEKIEASDAAAKLEHMFGIELHGVWGSEYSYRLLSVLMEFQFLRSNKDKPQHWSLVDNDLYPGDVRVVEEENSRYEKMISISKNAFKYAIKKTHERKHNGNYFSRRLFKAVIRATCLDSVVKMKYLFSKLHGVEILEPSELDTMAHMGKPITNYSWRDYQSWFKHPEELIELATSWSEYPAGFHRIKGLKYLLRRMDGLVNPEQPTAPAIAYPRGPDTDSYIEFMESGFYRYPDISKLVLHELGHFIDMNTLTLELQMDWQRIGGWYNDSNDPDGWSTRQQTQFVSSYAHKKNPQEDFASSLADYLLNPKKLMTRAPDKYNWIKKSVMGGAHYVTKSSHEFTVLNLGSPNFIYPGRIGSIVITVTGGERDNKFVNWNFKLISRQQSCATSLSFRLFSTIGTFVDIYLRPKGAKCGNTFEGTQVFNSSVKRGVWTTDQIEITDQNGLQRFVGAADFGLRVWINNVHEDFQDPVTIKESIKFNLVHDVAGPILRVNYLVRDDGILKNPGASYATINGDGYAQHSLFGYSDIPTQSPLWTGSKPSTQCNTVQEDAYLNCYAVSVNVVLSKNARSGKYSLAGLTTMDTAGNSEMLQWGNNEGPYIMYTSSGVADTNQPELKDITVTSNPTNIDKIDGETKVEISFKIRDQESGISTVWFRIRDPFGTEILLYPPEFDTSSNDWMTINKIHLLPRGSVPGVWHLNSIYVEDNAGNATRATLTENIYVSG